MAHGPRSVPVMQLAEAASGFADLLWLVDLRIPSVAEMSPLLRRFGPVVDIGGLDAATAASVVEPYQVDGITTYFDAGIHTLAGIAAALGLPFLTPRTALLVSDKVCQRQALRAANLAVPRFASVDLHGGASLAAAGAQVGWPAVLKPRSESGSYHTFLAADEAHAAELLAALDDDHEPMMLEEYLSDDPRWARGPYAGYVSVESVVAHGVISHVAVTGRYPPAEMFRETGFVIPAVLPAADQAQVLELASRSIRALGVETGCLHTEVKFTADGPRVLEVNGRVGGGIPEILTQAAAFPMLETTLRVALGEHVVVDGPIHCDRIGFRFFLQPPAIAGAVDTVDGVGALADHPNVESITLHRGPGARIDWRDGTREYVLAVVGTAEDYEKVNEVWDALTMKVTVSYTAEES